MVQKGPKSPNMFRCKALKAEALRRSNKMVRIAGLTHWLHKKKEHVLKSLVCLRLLTDPAWPGLAVLQTPL